MGKDWPAVRGNDHAVGTERNPRVLHCGFVLQREGRYGDYLAKRGLPIDSHPGTDYTSEVWYVSFAVTQIKQLIAAGK